MLFNSIDWVIIAFLVFNNVYTFYVLKNCMTSLRQYLQNIRFELCMLLAGSKSKFIKRIYNSEKIERKEGIYNMKER